MISRGDNVRVHMGRMLNIYKNLISMTHAMIPNFFQKTNTGLIRNKSTPTLTMMILIYSRVQLHLKTLLRVFCSF